MSDTGTNTRDELAKAVFRHRDALLSYAFVLLRNWAQAEDVIQETLAFVMERWTDFREGSEVFPWARKIVYYKALQAMRARQRESTLEENDLFAAVARTLDEHVETESAELDGERKQALLDCLSELSGRSLGLLRGFYWRLESCEAIGKSMGRSAGAVKVALARLRKQLKACMDRKPELAGS